MLPIVMALNIGGATTFDPAEGFIHALNGFESTNPNTINFTYASVGSGKGQTMLISRILDVALSGTTCSPGLVQIPLYFLNVRIGVNIPLTYPINMTKEDLIPIVCGLNSTFSVIRVAESYGQTRGLLDYLFGTNSTWKSACGNVSVKTITPPQALKLGHATPNAFVYGNIANFEFPYVALNGVLPTPEAIFRGLKFNVNGSNITSLSTNFIMEPGYACLLPSYDNITVGYYAAQFVLYLATSGMLELVNSVVPYPQQYKVDFFQKYLESVMCGSTSCIDLRNYSSVVYIENQRVAIISGVVIGVFFIITVVAAATIIVRLRGRISVVQLPPSGFLAFVFSDIEGSTVMWNVNRHEMKKIVSEHNRLATLCSERYSGYIVKYEGDAIFLSFTHVTDAIEYALAFQMMLSTIRIPDCFADVETCGALPIKHRGSSVTQTQSLRVRMGIHVGEEHDTIQTTRGYDYVGPTINYTARVASFANGGQVLLSSHAAACCLSPESLEFVQPDEISVSRAQGGLRETPQTPLFKSLSGLCEMRMYTQTKLNGITGLQTLYEIVNSTLSERLGLFPRKEILVSPPASPKHEVELIACEDV